MEIKILNSQTIKLTLTTKDMKKYNITHEILKSNEKITKNLIAKLLDTIKESITIDISKNKLFLECFKTREKGCILYLSVPQTNQKKTKKIKTTTEEKIPIIAIFTTKKNLKNFCKNINSIYKKQKDTQNELYCYENKFLLTIFVKQEEEKNLTALIKEFGNTYGKGLIKHSIIKEHYTPIFKENAIEEILKNF